MVVAGPLPSTPPGGIEIARPARAGKLELFLLVLRQHKLFALGYFLVASIIILALILDTAYQVIELGAFYPLEAIIVAVVLAFIPYLLIRGPAARIARWWSGGSASGGAR